MIILNSTTPLSEFSAPIRLAKSQPIPQDTAEQDSNLTSRRAFKRRTKIISFDEKTDGEEPSTCFVLEDFDGQHSLIGREEEGQEGHYIFLVNQVSLGSL